MSFTSDEKVKLTPWGIGQRGKQAPALAEVTVTLRSKRFDTNINVFPHVRYDRFPMLLIRKDTRSREKPLLASLVSRSAAAVEGCSSNAFSLSPRDRITARTWVVADQADLAAEELKEVIVQAMINERRLWDHRINGLRSLLDQPGPEEENVTQESGVDHDDGQ